MVDLPPGGGDCGGDRERRRRGVEPGHRGSYSAAGTEPGTGAASISGAAR